MELDDSQEPVEAGMELDNSQEPCGLDNSQEPGMDLEDLEEPAGLATDPDIEDDISWCDLDFEASEDPGNMDLDSEEEEEGGGGEEVVAGRVPGAQSGCVGVSPQGQQLLKQIPKSQFVYPPHLDGPDLSQPGLLDLWAGCKKYSKLCVFYGAPWVLCYEKFDNPERQDLLKKPVRAEIETMLEEGCFLAMGGGPVCQSMSRAVCPPCRTVDFPYGVEGLSAKQQVKVKEGNSFARWTVRLVRKFGKRVLFWWENPEKSWMWYLPCYGPLLRPMPREPPDGGKFLVLDYCRFGTPWRKRTRFFTNISSLQGVRCLCCGNHKHIILRGASPSGVGPVSAQL